MSVRSGGDHPPAPAGGTLAVVAEVVCRAEEGARRLLCGGTPVRFPGTHVVECYADAK